MNITVDYIKPADFFEAKGEYAAVPNKPSYDK